MAVIKTIEKGESLTFGFVLPETYNLANLQAVKIYIGSSIYEHKMDGRTVRVELESNQTALITGRNIVHFVIDDAVFGIKKINCGEWKYCQQRHRNRLKQLMERCTTTTATAMRKCCVQMVTYPKMKLIFNTNTPCHEHQTFHIA